VRADLATYGKIAGGGLPLSLIAGSARFMDRVDGGRWRFGDDSVPEVPTTFFAGTYCRHPLALTSALAMARILKREGPALQSGLNAATAALVERLNAAMDERRLPVRFRSFGSFFAIASSQSRMSVEAGSLLSLMLLAQGLHLRPGDRGGFLSTAHGEEERDFIFSCFVASLERLGASGHLPRTPGD
jgi:glutamate-1-semialdehyde 2,1-aminomutase